MGYTHPPHLDQCKAMFNRSQATGENLKQQGICVSGFDTEKLQLLYMLFSVYHPAKHEENTTI